MQAIRNFICFLVLVACIVLSFKGFPFGLISFIGFLTGATGWTAAISAICHPMGARGSRRLFTIILGFAIASLGRAIVNWGGLAFINIGDLPISVANLGAYMGVFGGLFNVDKSMHIANENPQKSDEED
jgi:hypothetical protein